MSLIIKTLNTIKNDGMSSFYVKMYRRFSSFFLRFWIRRPSTENWQAIKDIYKGETAYIIGNGPSLNETPLYLLKGEKTMVFNRFSLMLERLNWSPTFYSVTDDMVLEDMINEAAEMADKSTMAFFPDISFRGKVLFKKFEHITPSMFWLQQIPKMGFSTNLPKVNCGGTVIYEGFQILKHLGFVKIVFVGVDMNYQIHNSAEIISSNKTEIQSKNDDDPNHFDPRYFGKGRKYHQPEKRVIDNILNSLKYLSEIMGENDIQIVNAGVNSKVDYFPKSTLIDELQISENEIENSFVKLLEDFNAGSIESFKLLDEDNLSEGELPKKFKVDKQTGFVLIKRLAGKYIPLGPFQDTYYFIIEYRK